MFQHGYIPEKHVSLLQVYVSDYTRMIPRKGLFRQFLSMEPGEYVPEHAPASRE